MDYILLAVLALSIRRGWRRGFFHSFFSLIFFILAIVLALCFCEKFNGVLENLSFLKNFAESTLTSAINKIFPGNFENIENFFALFGNSTLAYFLSLLAKNIDFSGTLTSGQIFGGTTSDIFFQILSFLILWIFFAIIFATIKKVLLKIFSSGMLAGVDRIFGAIFGLLKGVIFCVFILFVCVCMANLFSNESALAFFTTGKISEFVFEKLLKIVMKVVF